MDYSSQNCKYRNIEGIWSKCPSVKSLVNFFHLIFSLLWQKFWSQRFWIWHWCWNPANDMKEKKGKIHQIASCDTNFKHDIILASSQPVCNC